MACSTFAISLLCASLSAAYAMKQCLNSSQTRFSNVFRKYYCASLLCSIIKNIKIYVLRVLWSLTDKVGQFKLSSKSIKLLLAAHKKPISLQMCQRQKKLYCCKFGLGFALLNVVALFSVRDIKVAATHTIIAAHFHCPSVAATATATAMTTAMKACCCTPSRAVGCTQSFLGTG